MQPKFESLTSNTHCLQEVIMWILKTSMEYEIDASIKIQVKITIIKKNLRGECHNTK